MRTATAALRLTLMILFFPLLPIIGCIWLAGFKISHYYKWRHTYRAIRLARRIR